MRCAAGSRRLPAAVFTKDGVSIMYIRPENIPNVCVYPLQIASYDVAPDGKLRPAAVLRYQQEAAERHFAPGGLGWQGMAALGMAFVCTRWHGQLLRCPGMGEQVTVETWHRQRKGPRFYRCYRWIDSAGEEIIRGVTEFALVSTADHRLLRGEEFDRFAIPDQPERGVACSDPGRLHLPPLSPAGEYRVRTSDADMNGHMNNTHYADLCEDLLPPETAMGEITLQFLHESRPGETVALESARESNRLYLRGSRGDLPVFAAEMVLTETGHGA